MKPFLDDHFLLHTAVAQSLYHEVAKPLPIIDYHNHLTPQHLATNQQFADLAELWITGDPYKHRAMRINGIAEQGITGTATGKEKFLNWVTTFPKTMGNPLFHWTCLELKRTFGIDELLSPATAEAIWGNCNTKLQQPGFGAVDLLLKFKAETVCTSDDLLDDLAPHQTATTNYPITVLPTLRADSIINFQSNTFSTWLNKLGEQVGHSINTLDDYEDAIIIKLNLFQQAGCKLADTSLDAGFYFVETPTETAATLFANAIATPSISQQQLVSLQSYLLVFLVRSTADVTG